MTTGGAGVVKSGVLLVSVGSVQYIQRIVTGVVRVLTKLRPGLNHGHVLGQRFLVVTESSRRKPEI